MAEAWALSSFVVTRISTHPALVEAIDTRILCSSCSFEYKFLQILGLRGDDFVWTKILHPLGMVCMPQIPHWLVHVKPIWGWVFNYFQSLYEKLVFASAVQLYHNSRSYYSIYSIYILTSEYEWYKKINKPYVPFNNNFPLLRIPVLYFLLPLLRSNYYKWLRAQNILIMLPKWE